MRVCGMKTVVPQSGLSVIGIWISDPMVNALPSPHPVQRKDEEQVRDVLRQFLPGANGPTMSLAACMFTNSPGSIPFFWCPIVCGVVVVWSHN